ncbi:hypothetical protein [Haloferax elongans]|uniref:hypothetical protein n=1 Tax=Haloferax elongans TaxID=403191 RepID=UPI000ABDD48F|nr:hypothetical protein [Haloferax elongans]
MSPSDASSLSSDDWSVLSRRRLLGLLGGGSAALAGLGSFAPTWLPDPITDSLTTVFPGPETNHVWRPPISDGHVDEAVAALEVAVERAQDLHSRLDPDEIDDPDLRAFVTDAPSDRVVESVTDEQHNWERLVSATHRIKYVGEAIGYAKFALGEEDPDALFERGRELRQGWETIADSISAYRVSDAGRDLGYLSAIERQLSSAYFTAHWNEGHDSDEGSEPMSEYTHHDIAVAWGAHLQTEQRLRNARRYRAQYRVNLGDDTRSVRDRLHAALQDMLAEIEQYPIQSELVAQLREEFGDGEDTPYAVARW